MYTKADPVGRFNRIAATSGVSCAIVASCTSIEMSAWKLSAAFLLLVDMCEGRRGAAITPVTVTVSRPFTKRERPTTSVERYS